MDLEFVDLPSKTVNTLRRHGNISTLEQLRELWMTNPREVECIRGIGNKQFKEIRDFILKMEGINLVEEKPKPQEAPIAETAGLCWHCEVPLKRIEWNTKGDMLHCDNPQCTLYQQPQGFVVVDRWRMGEVFT